MLNTTSLKRIICGVGAAAVLGGAALATAPAMADQDEGDRLRSRASCSGDNRIPRVLRFFKGLNVIGLTADQRLICFSEKNPDNAADIGSISGLAGDASLVGIDFRPANNTLYAVGNAGGIYTIDPTNAAATKVAQLTVALAGTSFGVDVNPAADALRIVSDTGQNLRFSFANGTTTMDGALTYPPATAPTGGVVGAAYTNNDLDPNTGTTLFDIDSMLDQVAVQSPANSGQLVPTGKLGVDAASQAGFDVYSSVRNGTTVDVKALASLVVDGQTRLYSVSLLTGMASAQGSFSTDDQVIGIAIPLDQG